MAARWESWENLFLYEVAATMPISMISEKLERSESAIYNKAIEIEAPLPNRMRGKTWTKPELFLIGRFTPQEIAIATGRSLPSVRLKIKSLARSSGGVVMREWSTEELSLLSRHKNAEVAEITGRSIEEVGDKRLAMNIERNGWDVRNPEQEDA